VEPTPGGWSVTVIKAYWDYEVDGVVSEINQGGDMVESILRMSDPEVSYKGVRATRGKLVRAEPISALYERKGVFHVKCFPILEKQMCSFTGKDLKSPDWGGCLGIGFNGVDDNTCGGGKWSATPPFSSQSWISTSCVEWIFGTFGIVSDHEKSG
jgi:hypothetical protein